MSPPKRFQTQEKYAGKGRVGHIPKNKIQNIRDSNSFEFVVNNEEICIIFS